MTVAGRIGPTQLGLMMKSVKKEICVNSLRIFCFTVQIYVLLSYNQEIRQRLGRSSNKFCQPSVCMHLVFVGVFFSLFSFLWVFRSSCVLIKCVMSHLCFFAIHVYVVSDRVAILNASGNRVDGTKMVNAGKWEGKERHLC